jgi:hypothetical protein
LEVGLGLLLETFFKILIFKVYLNKITPNLLTINCLLFLSCSKGIILFNFKTNFV